MFTVKVTLLDIKPLIWRRLRLPGDTLLAYLHSVLQTAFDWDGDHMHAFIKGWRTRESTYYGDPFHLDDCQDEVETRLADLLPKARAKGHYKYDFGDSWMHEIVLEKITQESARPVIAVCLAGKRAAPKEDCGGAYGFYEALAAAKNPKHPEHEDYKEWLGDFDPEAFDLAALNRALARLKL